MPSPLQVEQSPHRFRIGQEPGRHLGKFLQDDIAVDFGKVETPAQRIVMRQQPVDFVRQRVEVGEVHQTNGAAADFVLIGRSDAAPRGADRRVVR